MKKKKTKMKREEKTFSPPILCSSFFLTFSFSLGKTTSIAFDRGKTTAPSPMLRRSTRSNRHRVPPPPATRTRQRNWEEQLLHALKAISATKAAAKASTSASAMLPASTKTTAAAGEKENIIPPPPPRRPPLSRSPPPPPPPPPATPALDPKTAASGALLMHPMHRMQRRVDASVRRTERRKLAAEALAAAEAEESALEAALAKSEKERVPTRREELAKLNRNRFKLEKKLQEARERTGKARREQREAREARRERRLRKRGGAAAALLAELGGGDSESDGGDSESDFSDSGEHLYEREDITLPDGRCWVEKEKLFFDGWCWDDDAVRERERTFFFFPLRFSLLLFFPSLSLSFSPHENAHTHTRTPKQKQRDIKPLRRWFTLRNTQVTRAFCSSSEVPEGLEHALELVEVPHQAWSVAPDPRSAARGLHRGLFDGAGVEERARQETGRMRGAEVERTFDLRVFVQFFFFFFLREREREGKKPIKSLS